MVEIALGGPAEQPEGRGVCNIIQNSKFKIAGVACLGIKNYLEREFKEFREFKAFGGYLYP